jgi:hypothetical protein
LEVVQNQHAGEIRRSSSPAVSVRRNDFLSSSKLDALGQNLRRLRDQDPCFRAVVFSQWTGLLDLIETLLDRDRIPWCRLDGKMSQTQRTAALAEFARESRKPKVFIISLKSGGVGLNLTQARTVFLVRTETLLLSPFMLTHLCYADGLLVELGGRRSGCGQGTPRQTTRENTVDPFLQVHRIGQEHPVTVVKFVVSTVDILAYVVTFDQEFS